MDIWIDKREDAGVHAWEPGQQGRMEGPLQLPRLGRMYVGW